MTPATPEMRAETGLDRLVVAISSRALFDLSESHALFEREGLDAYRRYQIARENESLLAGSAHPLTIRDMSLKTTNTISATSRNTPTCWAISR